MQSISCMTAANCRVLTADEASLAANYANSQAGAKGGRGIKLCCSSVSFSGYFSV